MPINNPYTDVEAVAAVEAAGLSFADGKGIKFEETLGTDHTLAGESMDGTAGEDVVFGSLSYLKSDGKFWKTDADAVGTTKGLLAIAIATIAADGTGLFALAGYLRDDSWSWTVCAELFVSVTAGAITETAPVAAGDQVRKIGFAITGTIIRFEPDATVVGL